MLAASTALSFLLSLATARLLASRWRSFALDEPNVRSLHVTPVPRTGGLAVLAGTAGALAFIGAQLWLPMALAAALAAVSLYDDVQGLPRRMRFATHFAAAALLVWHVLSPMHPLELLLLLVAVVWVTNLYNFMDGADGVAGGMALIGFSAYAIAAWLAGDGALATLCAAIAAAAAGFLIHNFHPASIFLGDVGSIPLGFLAAALGIVGWRHDAWPLWFPLLVFGPFNADATVTFLRRLARREKVWEAHREHYYQRIVRMGFGHRSAALIGYAVMCACAAFALLGRAQSPGLQLAAFAAGSALLGVAALWVDVRWSRRGERG
jgi:UDP-N-acetylmuramyl pentapeptide phosphotransferase/UDP-N-acetylglucosamine-1-phosphate transferase